MSSTIFRKGALWVNDYSAFPIEVAGPLFGSNWRVIVCQAQDHGPIDEKRVRDWMNAGYLVGIAIRPSGEPLERGTWEPKVVAQWTSDELRRLDSALERIGARGRMTLVHFNFEDDVETADQASNGAWSEAFCAEWRRLRPTRASVLNTYKGARGMNLEAYRLAKFRFAIQTYDGVSLWADPMTEALKWTGERSIAPQLVRPCSAVYELGGIRIDPSTHVSDADSAGTVGLTAYYADGAPTPYLDVLGRLAYASGVIRR